MKNITKPATSKLVARFDAELKELLMQDLKAYREKNAVLGINKQDATRQNLSAA